MSYILVTLINGEKLKTVANGYEVSGNAVIFTSHGTFIAGFSLVNIIKWEFKTE